MDVTHRTCGLARTLGALVWARRLKTSLEPLMNVGDQRTMGRLIARAGLRVARPPRPARS